NHHSTDVSVVLGDGKGGLAAPTNYVVGLNPTTVVAGDFNGDGKIDLVTTDYGSMSISLLPADSRGDFQGALSLSTGLQPYAVVAGDINADGIVDLIVSNSGTGNLQVFL